MMDDLLDIDQLHKFLDAHVVRAMTIVMFARFCQENSIDLETFLARTADKAKADYRKQAEELKEVINPEMVIAQVNEQVDQRIEHYRQAIQAIAEKLPEGGFNG